MSVLLDTRDRLRALLTGTDNEERIEILVRLLASDHPESVYAALMLLRELEPSIATGLVPQLTELLASPLQVHCSNSGTGSHEPIAMRAYHLLRRLRIAPSGPALDRISAQPDQVISLPEACYDQGAYIGDYSVFEFRPAELVRQLNHRTAT